jgi:hypothetical protein
MGQDLCQKVQQQVEQLSLEGDDKIYFMAFDAQLEEDGVGANWHPNKITHGKMAATLEQKLREIMKW